MYLIDTDKINNTTKPVKIYIGIDHHTTNVAISFFNSETGEFKYERNDLPADNEKLEAYIKRMAKRHYQDGNYEFHCGYEAGYTGYSTARHLNSHHLDCVIMAPNTIKRSQKEKSNKTDTLDAKLIAQTLFNKDYSEVLIPTPEEESLSHLLNTRDSVTRQITKTKNQITALLAQKNFKSEAGKWSEQYMKDVARFMEEDTLKLDVFALEDLLGELERQQKRRERYDKMIEQAIEENEAYSQKVKELCSLKGISEFTAISVISVAKDARRFKTAESFANYLGLTPGERSSGKRQKKGGITKNGNSRLRSLLMLSAQTYCRGSAYHKSKEFLKNQEGLGPELVEYSNRAYRRLHKKFNHLRHDLHKDHNVCVAAVARELACFCWGILTGNVA